MKRKLLLTGLMVLIIVGPAVETVRATSVRIVNLEDMVRLADRIFWGRCVAVETENDSENGLLVRLYQFRVVEGVKGTENNQTIQFRQVLGFPGIVEGVPHYSKGEELLLFLHGDSRLGLTSPVGMYQGTFSVEKTPDGEVGFINPMKNRNLSQGLGSRSVSATVLSGNEMENLRSGRALSLSDLRSMVEKIDQVIQ